jgi:hypothetical protein
LFSICLRVRVPFFNSFRNFNTTLFSLVHFLYVYIWRGNQPMGIVVGKSVDRWNGSTCYTTIPTLWEIKVKNVSGIDD